MRKTFLTITMVGLLLCACTTTQEEELMTMMVATMKSPATKSEHRSAEDAVALAANYLTSTDVWASDVTPIMSTANVGNATSRSMAHQIDTLAYVINAPDSAGFALIAYDTTIPPLLAYSESGNFATEGEYYDIVYDVFLSRISESVVRRDSFPVTPTITTDLCTVIPPLMSGLS